MIDSNRVPPEWRDHYTRYQSMTAERGCEAIEEIARLTEENAALKRPVTAPACIVNEGFWEALNHFNAILASRSQEAQKGATE